MGCDIHLYTEKYITIDGKKQWFCCDHFKLNRYYGFNKEIEEYIQVPIYDGRDYTLFAALANVRNYEGTKPISEPRGLPKNVSDKVKEESESWKNDGHSYSWLTAKELFVYQNKHPFTTHSGMLEPEALKKFDEYGIIPQTWCQWTNIEGTAKRTWQVPGSPIDGLVEDVKKKMAEEFWIFDFYDDKKKEELYWKYADEFRIVFWFDN